ncbi:MAG: hypothetical protein DCF19_10935 [Pseudanabaena frigida]|uniref:Uncharacterized protein n=1 Tax=Pseudanabaena frigida TaxID=945775 RepID=A0A2W4WCA0_9CYAN|nr:MAG: hypothetical protein DCF19_10935 [Pseudanabaena frigida]
MLQTQKSLKSRFRAIWTSILLTAPPQFSTRLESLIESVVDDSISSLELTDKLELSIVAIAIGAYWHQDLQEVRSRVLALQSRSAADIEELVLAYAIAYGCRQEFQPQLFINQVCHDFSKRRALSRDLESQTRCLDRLQLAQKLVDEGASTIAAHQLDPKLDDRLSDAIASSLYYLLSTPHSWSLITNRAQKHNLRIAIQSGAMAAAYLGEVGEPINLDAKNYEIVKTGALLGDKLWAIWAGVYDSNCSR